MVASYTTSESHSHSSGDFYSMVLDAKLAKFGLSSDQALVFISAVKSLHYLQICLVAALLVDTPHKLKILATTMIASGICQAFYAGVILLLELQTSPFFPYR